MTADPGDPSATGSAGSESADASPRSDRLPHVGIVARTELRRSLRGSLDDTRSRIVAVVAVAVLAVGAIVTLDRVHAVGAAVRGGEALDVVPTVRGALAGALFLFTALFALRSVTALARPANVGLLTTAVPERSIVLGTLAAEYVRNAAVFGGIAALHAAAFGLGVGAPAMVLPALLLALLLLAVTMLLGYLIGVGVVALATRSDADATVTLVGLVAATVIGAGLVQESGGAAAVAPLADGAFLGTPLVPTVRVSHLLGFGVLASLVPVLAAAAVRAGPTVWFTGGGDGGTTEAVAASRPAVAPDSAVVRVAWLQWVRGIRNPVRFAHVAYLVLLLAPPATVLTAFPSLVPTVGAGLVAFTGAWFAGAAFALNPVDDEGPALPVVLLADRPPAVFVRGRIWAGAVPGAALVALGATVALVAGGGVATGAIVLLVGVAAAVFGGGVGAAIGFFSVEHADLGSGPSHEVPNPFVVVVYTVAAMALVAVAVAAFLAPGLIGALTPIPVEGASTVGAALVAAAFVAGPLGYRYAVGALARHTTA